MFKYTINGVSKSFRNANDTADFESHYAVREEGVEYCGSLPT